MKLHSTDTLTYQTVTAYDKSSVDINAITYEHSLVVMPQLPPQQWDCQQFHDLNSQAFDVIAKLKPDVVILGTGEKQHFIHPQHIQHLLNQHIGVECMDNQAACRTYNILMAEGRKVALALIINNNQ